jgi:hypothetical protein
VRTRAVSGLRGAAHYTQTNTIFCASGGSLDYEDFLGERATFAEYEDFFCASGEPAA